MEASRAVGRVEWNILKTADRERRPEGRQGILADQKRSRHNTSAGQRKKLLKRNR
jgi:hypothetical protein